MTCRELTDFLDDYLCGDLDASARKTFDAHLRVCPDCVSYLNTYRRTIDLAQAAYSDGSAPVPNEVPPDLLKAVVQSQKSKK